MTVVKLPEVTSSLLPASAKAGVSPQKVLFIGQKTAAGSAAAGELVENIGNDNSWDGAYGSDSMLAAMLRAGRKVNAVTQFDAIAVTDGGASVAATGTLLIVGDATEDGTYILYIGSKKNNAYTITVADSDTPTITGDAIVAAITADNTCPVDAVNVAGTVTFTAVNKGPFGNTIGLALDNIILGTATIFTGMSGGTGLPALTSVFDAVGEKRYQTIVWPYDTDLSTLTDFLDPRFNVDNDILDGVGFVSTTDTLVNQLALLADENSESLSINTDKLVTLNTYTGPAVLEIPVVKAAQFASIRALRLTEDASIGSFVITRSARDASGGPALASKPYFNTPFPDLELVNTGAGWEDTEVKQLKAAGGWVIGNNRASTEVITGELVTTYKTDAAGNPDPTFTFLNYVDTASAIREYFVNNYRSKYAQFRLTAGALIRGRDSANANSLAAFAAELNSDLGGPDFALTQTGVGDINGTQVDFDKLFRDNVDVTLDLIAGKAVIALKAYIIVQLRVIQIPIQIAFSPEG